MGGNNGKSKEVFWPLTLTLTLWPISPGPMNSYIHEFSHTWVCHYAMRDNCNHAVPYCLWV